MPLIITSINNTATTTTTTKTATDDLATIHSYADKPYTQTANTAKITALSNQNNNNNNKKQQQQQKQQPRHYHHQYRNNKYQNQQTCIINESSIIKSKRKMKLFLAQTVPATPVQEVNPLTTNNFVPSSPQTPTTNHLINNGHNQLDNIESGSYDEDDDVDVDVDDANLPYLPPYLYPRCTLEASDDNDEYLFKATNDNHAFELPFDNDGDTSSLAMITPPPPYDTPPHRQQQKQQHLHIKQLLIAKVTSSLSNAAATTAASTVQQERQHQHHQQKSAATRKYLFNNREIFNISSSTGNSSSNSLHQQPPSYATSSVGSTLANAITPTKLSAAAAAMFTGPHLNRKWSHLHRKRRRRNSSSGDSKELDKLVLQSVDWDDDDIY